MKTLITTILLILAVSQAEAYWEATNGPYGGASIVGLEMHNGILFASAMQNMIYKYAPETDSWIMANNGIPSNIRYILNMHSYKDKLFVGTDKGIFLTTDNGTNWVEKGEGLMANYIKSIKSVGDVLFAGTIGAGRDNFYISEDDGATWFIPELNGLPTSYSVLSMVYAQDRLYIGTFIGLFYTTDLGNNWTELKSQNGNSFRDIRALASIDKKLYIGTDEALFISGNSMILNQTPGGGTKSITSISVYENNVVVTTDFHGVFHSNNEGLSWLPKNGGLPNTDFMNASLIFEGITYIGIPSSGGVYKSSDYGTNWVKKTTKGLAAASVVRVLFAQDKLYASVYGLGIAQSSNDGMEWEFINEGLEHLNLIQLCECNNTIYAVQDRDRNVYYKNINDESWNVIPSSNFEGQVWFRDIECNKNEVFIIETNGGTYKLNENKSGWTKILDNSEINQIVNDEMGFLIRAKWLLDFNDNLIVGTNRGIIYSDDSGENWHELNLGESFHQFDIRQFSKSGEHIYVLYDYIDVNSSIEKKDQIMILEFENNNRINLDINFDKDIGTIYVVNGFIFLVATDWKSIYLSNDLGITWLDVSLPQEVMFTGSLTYNNEYIFIGTSNGVWRGNLLDFSIIVSVPENEIEEWNYLYTYPPYPVPARSEVQTKIYFDSSTDIAVENIAVYDIYGRKLPTKENLRFEQETFYSGNIIWNCSGVEPGVYIIRINHGTAVRAVKVIVGY